MSSNNDFNEYVSHEDEIKNEGNIEEQNKEFSEETAGENKSDEGETTVEAIESDSESDETINEASETNSTADETVSDSNVTFLEPEKDVKYISEPKPGFPRFKNARAYVAIALISSLVTASAVGGGLYYKFSNDINQLQATMNKNTAFNKTASSSTSGVKQVALQSGSAVTDVVKNVAPSVVGIRVTNTSTSMNIFGQQQQSQQGGEGSGVIIDKDGYIMTNYHVVSAADPKVSGSKNTTVEVFLSDKRQAKATFVGGDEQNDLAVIKVDLTDLPVADLGDSSTLQAGETAIAIGNPLGMEFAGSVTVGVISSVERTMDVDGKSMKLIQTDAAINPGNSGGALVNSQGQVIGINSVKISATGVEGLGFAIPVNVAKPIVDQLKMFGYVKGRPYIGISGMEVTDAISKAYNVPVGFYVQTVEAASGAANAGIQRGDIITSMDGKDIKTLSDLDEVKKAHKAGDTVEVKYDRNSKTITANITFTEQK